jgi:hypothetical protein
LARRCPTMSFGWSAGDCFAALSKHWTLRTALQAVIARLSVFYEIWSGLLSLCSELQI